VLEAVKAWPGKLGAGRKVGAAANLDSSCARRRQRTAVRDEETALRSNKKTDEGQKICRSCELLDKKIPIQGHIMSHDRSSVEAVVRHYFDGLYEGSADKLGAIFDPSADLRWVEKGELQVLTVPDWLDRVRKRPSAKAEGKPREDFIVTIDHSDESTAFIKVRCQLPPRYFTDYLVAMKLADGWKIVSKSYRYDLRE
jgi:hypothetical protein